MEDIDNTLPLRDVVFNTLRRKILMGELAPGERLMEMKLTKSLGVSRTPVRDAIHMLELDGLVTIVPRRGASVSEITKKDLQDVLEVRCALEELAVELACSRISKEGVDKLMLASNEFAESTVSGDVQKMAEKDVAFHDIIINATGNGRLVQQLANLSERMYRYRVEYLKDKSVYSNLVVEHEDIIRCLRDNAPEEARRSIKKHITNLVVGVSREIKDRN